MQVFVTGTDTSIGKTVITAGLAAVMQSLGYKAGVYKPIQNGAMEQNGFLISPDLSYVKKMDFYIETLGSYLFKTNASPQTAAELENTKIDLQFIKNDYQKIKNNCEITIIEGTGGLMVPVKKGLFVSDIAKELDAPLLIVARADLGTVNHTLLTISHAKAQGLKIAGIIINCYPQTADTAIKTAPKLIEEYSGEKILGIVPEIEEFSAINPGKLIDTMVNNVDIESIFRIKIPKLNIK